MSEIQQPGGGFTLSTRTLMPSLQRVGVREIEVTFLGKNASGQPTWVLWNPAEPFLIGVLSQGKLGFTLEQRTDQGVMLHEDISFSRLQRALGA